MPMTDASEELSLINDPHFFQELGELDGEVSHPLDPSASRRPVIDDGFWSLENGLPVDPHAAANDAPHYDRQPPTVDPYDDPPPPSRSAESRVPFLVAVMLIVACLVAGAATAAYVFHDGLTRITATSRASR